MCEGYSKNMMTWGKPYYNNWGKSYCNNGGRPCRSGYNLRPLATRGGAWYQRLRYFIDDMIKSLDHNHNNSGRWFKQIVVFYVVTNHLHLFNVNNEVCPNNMFANVGYI